MAEKTYKVSKQQLQQFLDSGPTLISYVDADGRYRWVNKAYGEWFGIEPEKMHGRYVKDVVGEEAWNAIEPYMKRSLSGETTIYEQKLGMRDGTGRWIRAIYTPDIDESGCVRGFVVHAVDIEEWKKSEEKFFTEKSFSDSAINSMPGAFYLFDRNGKFLRWNKNLENVTGYSAQEIAAMTPLDLFDHKDKSIIANAILRAFNEGHVSVEANFRSKSGDHIPYYFIADRMFVEGVPYLIGSGVDMTGSKEAEATQRATLNLLEDFGEEKAKIQLVQQATMNLLEDMNEERNKLNETQRAVMNILDDVETERNRVEQAKTLLEAVNKELEGFSYSVSHDLRAPLRAISGFAQAVMEDYAPKLDDEGKRYLRLIEENATKMGQLIDDLLTFSRLGRQQMMGTSIDISAMAKEVFHELASQAPQRDIEFIDNPSPPARVDRPMIRQVLANLLSNAIKFTRKKDKALIEFGWRAEDSAYYIKDNGVGFDMQYSDKLFGVFQRLHSLAEFEGTGVGLALVFRIVTRHGGRVWADSKPGEGATFYFTLPVSKGESK